MFSLKEKIVLITGASSGIGYSAAIEFAKAGSRLILVARRKEKLLELEKELKKQYGIKILLHKLDVRNQKAVVKFVDGLKPEWKNIDILINNAGLSRGLDKLYDADIQDWEEMIDTNIKGLLYLTRYVLPIMVKRNSGHVVNIASIAGYQVYPGGNVYCATKHAVRALSEALRRDVFGTDIRVSCINPGMANTEFSTVRFHGDKKRADDVYKGWTPLTAEDIADSIIFACTRPPHVNISEILIMPTDQAAIGMINKKK